MQDSREKETKADQEWWLDNINKDNHHLD